MLFRSGEPWVEDETNEDLVNPRNRVRHRVLPELDLAAGGPTRGTIARAAGLIREDGEWLDRLAGERFEALTDPAPTGLEFDAAALTAEPAPVVRRLLLRALRQVAWSRVIGLDHVEAVMAVLAGENGGVDVPGSRVELRRGKLVLIQRKGVAK